MTDILCSQIPIPEATAYLLGDHQEYTNWQEYRARYWRKATQEETRVHYNDLDDGRIIVHATRVERENVPEPPNKPFQRFCVIPDRWWELARDMMIENEYEFVEQFENKLRM